MQNLADLVGAEIVALLACSFKRRGPSISVSGAMKFVAARLRDNVYHPTFGLAILRLEARGLHLHLFHKGSSDAGAQATIGTRERADAPECRIGNVNAVGNV